MNKIIVLMLLISCSGKETATKSEYNITKSINNEEFVVEFGSEDLILSSDPEIIMSGNIGEVINQRIVIKNDKRTSVSLANMDINELNLINGINFSSDCKETLLRFRSCKLEIQFSPEVLTEATQSATLIIEDNIVLINFQNTGNTVSNQNNKIISVIDNIAESYSIEENKIISVNSTIRNLNRAKVKTPVFSSTIPIISNCPEYLGAMRSCSLLYEISGKEEVSTENIVIYKDGEIYKSFEVNYIEKEQNTAALNLNISYESSNEENLFLKIENFSRQSFQISEIVTGTGVEFSGCNTLSRFRKCILNVKKINEISIIKTPEVKDGFLFDDLVEENKQDIREYIILEESENSINLSYAVFQIKMINEKFLSLTYGFFNNYDYDSNGEKRLGDVFSNPSFHYYFGVYDYSKNEENMVTELDLVYSPCENNYDYFKNKLLPELPFKIEELNNEINFKDLNNNDVTLFLDENKLYDAILNNSENFIIKSCEDIL